MRNLYLFSIFCLFISVPSTELEGTNYSNFDKIIDSSINENKNELLRNDIFVFISFSMPDSLIRDYIDEARNLKESNNVNIVFVLRGFYNNSFKETSDKINQLANGRSIAVIVDPTLYEKYNINLVPSIIKNSDHDYDKLTGSVTISYAIELFAGGNYE